MSKYIFLLFIFISGIVQAQTIIKGTVLDEKKQPVPDINVTINETGQAIMLNYVMTDLAGKYRLEYKGKSDSIVVAITGFNIKKQVRIIANYNQDIDFSLEVESIVLNEVKIKPSKIRQAGDTLNYLVESFTDASDRTIADALKKMPGIEVKESGAIYYQDKPINKFYIENADLLQGRYGIATNSIEAKDVATVQVMENHQPIRALKDKEFSEEAAINLKLKDSAKGTIIANAQAGVGGGPLLWNNELTGMYISKKIQNITTYKGNNSGDDVSREHSSFYSNDASKMSNSGLLSVQSPTAPPVGEKRYMDNQVNTVSFNNLWSLKNDYQLTTNINYLNDFQQRSSYANTEHYLPGDSLMQINELLDLRLRKERLGSDIQLNANKNNYYFNNLLKIETIWDRERGDALSEDSVHQYLHKSSYSINNSFNMVKTTDKYTWNFYSFNGYNSSSQTLNIQPVLYAQLFDPVSLSQTMVQDVEQDNFALYSRVSFGMGKNSFKQNYTLGFNADIQKLNSDLHTGINWQIPDSLKNDLKQDKLEWVFTPNYTYAKGQRFNMSLSLPVSYIKLRVNNYITNKKENDENIYFNPSFIIHYKFSAYWNSYINAGYSNSTGNIDKAYTSYIMSTYRNLLRNEGKLFKQQIQTYGLSLNYRDPITTLFGMGNITYFRNRANLLYDNHYQGILKMQSTIDIPNTTTGIRATANVSKEIECINSTLFFSGSYVSSRSSQIAQEELIDYVNDFFSFSPRILTKIGSVVSVQYQFLYSKSISKMNDEKRKLEPMQNISQNAQVNIFPMKSVVINLKYENYYNDAILSGRQSMSFGDISVKYKWKKAELMLDYTNIFNSRQFVSTSYNDVSRYYYSYNLRPAEILLKARFKLK